MILKLLHDIKLLYKDGVKADGFSNDPSNSNYLSFQINTPIRDCYLVKLIIFQL